MFDFIVDFVSLFFSLLFLIIEIEDQLNKTTNQFTRFDSLYLLDVSIFHIDFKSLLSFVETQRERERERAEHLISIYQCRDILKGEQEHLFLCFTTFSRLIYNPCRICFCWKKKKKKKESNRWLSTGCK